jgi:hypothetical protein
VPICLIRLFVEEPADHHEVASDRLSQVLREGAELVTNGAVELSRLHILRDGRRRRNLADGPTFASRPVCVTVRRTLAFVAAGPLAPFEPRPLLTWEAGATLVTVSSVTIGATAPRKAATLALLTPALSTRPFLTRALSTRPFLTRALSTRPFLAWPFLA